MSDSPSGSLHDIKIEILQDIKDDFKKQVHFLLLSRRKWRTYENFAETMAHVLLLFGTILTFASGVFDRAILSFISGGILSLSASLLKLANYCHAECIERNLILNDHLARVHIKNLPQNTNQISEI